MKIKRKQLGNKGLSLVELIATVAIMAIVSVGIGTAIVSTTKSYSSGSGEVSLQQETQNITNIINNLIIDATFAANEQGNANVLIVENTSDEFYRLEFDPTTSILLYEQIVPESPADDYAAYKAYITDTTGVVSEVGYTVLGEHYELSSNVSKFNATPGSSSGEWDYTVYFDMAFVSHTAGVASTRNMSTSFLTTSRNGEAYKEYSEVDGAVIVVDNEVVIEPNQSLEGDKGIPFEVLFSGDTSSASVWVDFEDVSSGSTAYYSGSVDTEKKLNVKAGADQVKPIVARIHAKVGSTVVNSTVEFKVRRVNGITDFSSPTVTGTYAKAASTYEFRPLLNVQNGDRFFALSMDDDYVTPYISNIELDKSYSGSVTFKIYKVSDNSLVDTKVNTGFSIDYRENYFTASINEDLKKGDSIVIRTIATHAGNSSTDTTANNKTRIKYNYVYDEYPIELGLFPNATFHRGSEADYYYNIDLESIKTDNILNIYIERYIEKNSTLASAMYAELVASEPWRAYQTVWDASIGANRPMTYVDYFTNVLKGRLSGKVHSVPFYSIGSKSSLNLEDFKNSLTNDGKTNNYVVYDGTGFKWGDKYVAYDGAGLEWSSGYYWSQYRPLGKVNDDGSIKDDATSMGFTYDMSYRLDADKAYSVEFVDVLFIEGKVELFTGDYVGDNDYKKILWPYYPKLLGAGFSDAGFSFDTQAESLTGTYNSFANHFEVGRAEILFKENSSFGIVSGARSVGTETSPLSLNLSGGEKCIYFDNEEKWIGLGHNMFINHNAISLKSYYGAPPSWNDEVTHKKGEYICSVGGFKVSSTDELFRFMKNGGSNPSAIFKMTSCLVGVPRAYIKDSDGIFSKKIYKETDLYDYDYPDGDGDIYFTTY